MTESANDLKSVAVAPATVESHALCRHCTYDLHGLPADGRCPECGASVADSLREELLVFADPDWLATLLRGVRMLVIGCGLIVVLVVFLLFYGNQLPSNSSTTALGFTIAFIICWCVIGAWFLSTPDPSGAGEREYGIFRKVARWAAVLGALQGLLDLAAIYWVDSAPSFSEHVFSETIVAQIIGVVGVFTHLQYLEKLTGRTADSHLPPFAKLLKIAMTLAWGTLYLFSLLATFPSTGYLIVQAVTPLVVIDLLVGGVFLLFYPFFLFALGATLTEVLRKARKAKP